MERVLIPANPGVFSAWGMLQGDVRHDAVTTHYRRLDQPFVDLTEPIGRLKDKVCHEMEVDDDPAGRGCGSRPMSSCATWAQEYSLPIPLPGTVADGDFSASFHARYEERYGHCNPEAPVEMVAIRLTGIREFERGPSGDGNGARRLGRGEPRAGDLRRAADGGPDRGPGQPVRPPSGSGHRRGTVHDHGGSSRMGVTRGIPGPSGDGTRRPIMSDTTGNGNAPNVPSPATVEVVRHAFIFRRRADAPEPVPERPTARSSTR